MIVLLGGEKGGTGKSTLAVHMAALRAKEGRDVLLVDTDRQGSGAYWSGVRDEAEVKPGVPCVQVFGERAHYELKRLGEKYQDVVIDAGGRDSVELRAAMVTAQKLYTPLLPSQFDAWTLDKMAYLLKEVRAFNPDLIARGVLNRVSTNPQVSEAVEAQEYMGEFDGIDLAKTVIRDRIAFRRAVRDGLSVVEMDRKDEKAIQEIESFYREVFYE